MRISRNDISKIGEKYERRLRNDGEDHFNEKEILILRKALEDVLIEIFKYIPDKK